MRDSLTQSAECAIDTSAVAAAHACAAATCRRRPTGGPCRSARRAWCLLAKFPDGAEDNVNKYIHNRAANNKSALTDTCARFGNKAKYDA